MDDQPHRPDADQVNQLRNELLEILAVYLETREMSDKIATDMVFTVCNVLVDVVACVSSDQSMCDRNAIIALQTLTTIFAKIKLEVHKNKQTPLNQTMGSG